MVFSTQTKATEAFGHSVLLIREGSGTPLQYSCLENPMDGGAWWAAVHGVAKSQTRLSDFPFTFTFTHWRRKWQPTPVFLLRESQGRGSLVGCRLWGRTESGTTEVTQQQQQGIGFPLSPSGEGQTSTSLPKPSSATQPKPIAVWLEKLNGA